MHYTNKNNLPQYLVDWLIHDSYDYNQDPLTLSATTLMKPVRAYWLTARHGDKLEIDVSELVAARLGSAIHDSIERVETDNVFKEERVKKTVEIDGVTFTISGKYDILTLEGTKWILRDIKTTSVWAYIYGGKDEDYRKQLSIYRWLLHGEKEVEPVAYIDMIFTDWQSMKAKTEDNYPPQRIHPGYRIELLSLEETEAYIRDRLSNFYKYKDVTDSSLPNCSKEELWASEDTYAVMKPDAKRATKVCDSKQEAEAYMVEKKIKGFVDFRPGKVKRCNYCSAAPFCSQYKSMMQAGIIEYRG